MDALSEVSESEGITAMPTFKSYKNGAKAGELVGANVAKLEDLVKQLL